MKTKKRLELIKKLIENRYENNEKELKEAINNKRWSKVAALDGISVGLLIANRIVQEEIEYYGK